MCQKFIGSYRIEYDDNTARARGIEVAKKSKGEKKSEKQAKDVKKLRKAVEELGEQNEKLAKTVEKLHKSQEESRGEFESLMRDLESRIEALPDGDSDTGSAVTVGADGDIVSGDNGFEELSEETSDTPTVSADDGISSDAPGAAVKATESAKRKADELGVDLTDVEGTGSRNRVTVADVEKAAEKR